jgi:uncharacterized membrane protein YphA (DoxX/SURF4 family)
MPHLQWKAGFTLLLRTLLGLVFLYAAAGKIIDPQGFARTIGNYQILPAALIPPAAVVLPWIEAACGLLLITGFFVQAGALIVNALMVVFIAAFAFNLYRGIDISCGCFTTVAQPVRGDQLLYILRDAAILAAGLWVMLACRTGRRELA